LVGIIDLNIFVKDNLDGIVFYVCSFVLGRKFGCAWGNNIFFTAGWTLTHIGTAAENKSNAQNEYF
jgi:hypothetical protein